MTSIVDTAHNFLATISDTHLMNDFLLLDKQAFWDWHSMCPGTTALSRNGSGMGYSPELHGRTR